MKFVWEVEDFKSDYNNGLLARKKGEIIVVTGNSITHLIDGWVSQHDKTVQEIVDFLNKFNYVPVFKFLNANEVLIKMSYPYKVNEDD